MSSVASNNGKLSRVQLIQEWHREGGVILLGYSLFRDFCMGKGTQVHTDAMQQCREMLQGGASLVIADEGHLLKNVNVSWSQGITTPVNEWQTASTNTISPCIRPDLEWQGKLAGAVGRIESVSRIILTGYPLQNRLEEYYCMVDFVRPNFLGEYNTFRANYVKPILAGLYPDSSPSEIKVTLDSAVEYRLNSTFMV